LIHHSKRPILYVDDTVEQRYAMRRILETEGFRILEAGSGKEAISLLDPTLALAVVDVKLPDISGYELSRKIKQQVPHLPILQVSASFSDPDLRAAGFSGEADAYIAQPVHPAELTALIHRMLRTSEAEESLRYLAMIGPAITSSLSLEETIRTIRNVMVPRFADECQIFIRGVAGQEAAFWKFDDDCDDEWKRQVERQATETTARMVGTRSLLVPLALGGSGAGAIAFRLGKDREYTRTDLVLASDLANRAGLALQNCILFASEQSTRTALIQSEKLATAGRMAAAIAHEINNPLEALTNLLYIIERSPETPPPIQEIATAALAEVTRLAHITRQTLGFYRELRAPSKMDLSQSVSETVELYTSRTAAKQIEIKQELGGRIEIQGIKGEIRQVISNLLVNAIEAVENGGRILVATHSRDGRAVFCIEDNGSGVEDHLRARIFEPFFTTKQGTGTGLGLWITHSIIEKHGGSITLTGGDGSGKGTTFTVEFPQI
jgi:two-component system NtrC family sensor kinase